MKTRLAILSALLLAATARAEFDSAVLFLPDAAKQAAETNAALRLELRQGLCRLWGSDTNAATAQTWADNGWEYCRYGSVTGWAYRVTMSQTGGRLLNNTLFTRWQTRIRALGGELWRSIYGCPVEIINTNAAAVETEK